MGGVVTSVGDARRRVNKLGVMVGAEEDDDADAFVMRRDMRIDPRGDVRGLLSWITESLPLGKPGEDNADSYESKNDDEGV